MIFFLIEHSLSKYERSKINKDVFEGVLRKVIPESLFDIVANDTLYKDFIRKNVRWEYVITDNIIRRGYDLTQWIIYEFCNISGDKKSVDLSITVHQSEANAAIIDSFKVQDMEGTPTQVIIKGDGLERIVTLNFKPGQTLKVIQRVRVEYANYHVTDCHYTNYSIIGLELSVQKPASCKFRPLHTFSSPLEVLKEDETNILYKPVKGLLKGQALVYFLDKEDPGLVTEPAAGEENTEVIVILPSN